MRSDGESKQVLTTCFSKSKEIHEIVIGIFINIFFFHRKLPDSLS
ncbi:MAG TPA: hypothetical protein DCO72_01075 [Ruminococcus sp.]|nr:hypothetical protein [Ruminococcus sp.]